MFIRGSYIAARVGATGFLHANQSTLVIPASCGRAHDGLARYLSRLPQSDLWTSPHSSTSCSFFSR